MNEDFEQNSYSNSAAGIYKIGHVSIRIMKWLAYYDKVKYKRYCIRPLYRPTKQNR